ncbi:MAG: hypothetical protein BRC32_02355 [Actinobacteria bacterium QS_8_72_14]|nr:MAG: hypothetical protein BRC32_02355 [Actinobacteria bacterium QS_8_72_14]
MAVTTAPARIAPLSPTVEDACQRWGPKPALTTHGTTLTYQELGQRIRALASAYETLGVARGDRILCQLRNCNELIIAAAAAWQRGAVHVGADNDLTGAELSRLVERLEAAALIYQPSRDATEPLAPLHTVADAHPDTPLIVHDAPAGPYHSLAALLESDQTTAADRPAPLDPGGIFLTSGTTGEPKAVVEPIAEHWAKMQFFADAVAPGEDDVQLLFLPISHVFGLRLAFMTLLRGGHLVLADRFSPSQTLELVERKGVTLLPAVPTHLRLLRQRYDPSTHDLASLGWVISAAAALSPQLAEWVYETLQARMMFVFGCSEGFTTLTTKRDDILAGSVGNTVFQGPPGTPPDGTVRIADPQDDTTLPPGETGEIAFGATHPVRYWDQPATATDGWYRTGDLGHLDEHGRVVITGRLKEQINRGGLHVSMAEVEKALLCHPRVADAALLATPNTVLGEAVCACVVPDAGPPPDLAELHAFLCHDLARHKLPDELCVLDEIPRTVIGKVDRAALRDRVLDGEKPRERLTR